MGSEPYPEGEEEDIGEAQDSDGAFKLPEEAKQLIRRLITSRRWRELTEEFGMRDSSTEENEEQ